MLKNSHRDTETRNQGRGRRSLCLRVSVAALLLGGAILAQTGDGGWRPALSGYRFEFARDHGSHPDYKIEWWYYTGNLAAADGRRFGYQLTFFRVGVDPRPENPSRWAVRDLFMAHLAVSDIDGGQFRFAERLNRAGVGWAGAAVDGYRVWNEDWEARLGGGGRHELRAADGEIGLELELGPGKPPVSHGSGGVSRKGAQAGNASHYYSLTRMPTRGTLVVGGSRVAVEGLSWMDHEFGTSFLEAGKVGWDWFSIQLEDGTDLMLYEFKRADGARDAYSSGTLIGPGGEVTALRPEEFALAPGARWRSQASGAAYPVAWRISLPGRGLELEARAALEDQELRLADSTGVTYWEGAIEVGGTRAGRPVRGRGYLEMTGYAGAAMTPLLE